jgi:hypothetical protein
MTELRKPFLPPSASERTREQRRSMIRAITAIALETRKGALPSTSKELGAATSWPRR